MGTLDEIMKMKNQGKNDEQIYTALKQKGTSPKEIENAMDQAKIKNAVTDMKNMELSIINQRTPPTPSIQEPIQDQIPQEQAYIPQEYSQQSPAEYYPQENYDYPQGMESDTIVEIAEQVFLENEKKIQKQLEELNEFKTLTQARVEDFSERLKRIETTIHQLEVAILEKVGSYGQGINNIKNEMSMMQDSFGKIVNTVKGKTPKAPQTKRIAPVKKTITRIQTKPVAKTKKISKRI